MRAGPHFPSDPQQIVLTSVFIFASLIAEKEYFQFAFLFMNGVKHFLMFKSHLNFSCYGLSVPMFYCIVDLLRIPKNSLYKTISSLTVIRVANISVTP